MANVEQPPLVIPARFMTDADERQFFQSLIECLRQVRNRSGGGLDYVQDAQERPWYAHTTRNDRHALDTPPALTAGRKVPDEGLTHMLLGRISAFGALIRGFLVPSGMIAIWSGSTATIPTGWVICDGNNGTPDLRGNFVIGAGGAYAVDDTGGSATYSLDVTSTSTVATNQNTTSTMGGPGSTTEVQSGTGVTVASNIHDHVMNAHTHTQNTHTHDVTDTIDTLPPYYALAFIMKI